MDLICLSLASMVSRGRKVASPSKKVRREGDLEIFLQLAAHVDMLRPGYRGCASVRLPSLPYIPSLRADGS